MVIHVLKCGDTPNLAGKPAAWPAQCTEQPDGTPAIAPWVAMTLAEFAAYKEANRADYNTWLAARPPDPEIVAAAADANERTALRNVVTALNNGTGTAAERLARLERVAVYLLKNI